MPTDPRIDAYIAAKPAFARPILEELRARVHAACPEVEETIKWGAPFFILGGAHLANMAAFKAHVVFGFWRGPEVMGDARSKEAMGSFGRIASLDDLPDRAAFAALMAKAAALAASGGASPRPIKHPKPELDTPADFAAALDADPPARATFDAFTPAARRDYLQWIAEAKRPETRAARIAQATAWIAEGKKRHWKYDKC